MAAFRAGFLKLFSEFLQKGIFAGIVNVAVQHKALLIIVRPVKGHWIMTQDDVPSGISNLFVIGNVLKEALCRLTELPRVVIAADQHFIAGQPPQPCGPQRLLLPDKITQAMLTDFAKKGVCTAVQYLNFSNHAAQNERGGIEASGTLGGRKAWNSLLEDAKTGGTPVYATTNFLSFTSDGALVSRFTLAAVQLSSFPVKLNRYLISTHKTDANAAADYVLKAEKVSQEAQSALSAYEALGADVALGDAANLLYSDYSQDNGLRDTLKAGIEVLYAQTEGALESFPNAYALRVRIRRKHYSLIDRNAQHRLFLVDHAVQV